MKRLALILAPLLLAACASTHELPKPEVLVAERIEYVVRIPPAELMNVPPPPANIDVETATQATVANWLILNEEYINSLRNRIIEIAKFLKQQQDELNDEAKNKNLEAGTLKPLAPLEPLSPPKPTK